MIKCGGKKGIFYQHHACAKARVWGVKNEGAKIEQCSRMGNFCPHVAASPKSVQEYEYIVYSCTIGDDGGGEVYLHFWQIGMPPGI